MIEVSYVCFSWRLAVGILIGFSIEWYEKNPQHLSFAKMSMQKQCNANFEVIGFSIEWYEKNPQHLNFAWMSIEAVQCEFRSEDWLGAGVVLKLGKAFLPCLYIFSSNAELKAFKTPILVIHSHKNDKTHVVYVVRSILFWTLFCFKHELQNISIQML